MALDQSAILDALKVVRDPDLNQDIVSLGFIKDLTIDGSRVSFAIELTTPACPVKEQMHDQAVAAVRALPGVADVQVQMTARVRSASAPEKGGPPHLAGTVMGGVTLICQRCMLPYVQPLAIDVDLRPVSSEAEEARLLRDADPYLLSDEQLPLHAIIEDEVLLALPMAPHCERPDCGGAQPGDSPLN